jgi:hypothetical protein
MVHWRFQPGTYLQEMRKSTKTHSHDSQCLGPVLKMGVASSFLTLAPGYQTTKCHITNLDVAYSVHILINECFNQ